MLMALPALAQGGKVVVDGKAYTVHQVLQGETFYSISVTYNVHVDSLRNVNRLADPTAGIRPGDILIIPLYALKGQLPPTTTAPAAPATTPPNNSGAYLKHTVVTGETLYSVARLYPHTTVAAIKLANDLPEEGLSIGQVLLIPAQTPNTTPVTPEAPPASKPAIDSNALYLPHKPSGSIIPTDPNVVVAATPEDADTTAAVASFDLNMLQDFQRRYQTEVANGKEETTTGTATWINDPSHENQYRFYAMHKTAPLGSIVKVKNLMNDRVVYAKVIGKLPNIKSNEKIVVKLSGGAARYLNVLDDKFMVELSLPQAKL